MTLRLNPQEQLSGNRIKLNNINNLSHKINVSYMDYL